jgi:hypothetical protein
MTNKNLEVSQALRYMSEDYKTEGMTKRYDHVAARNNRITKATEDAIEAFWASIAKSFPEITSGDLSPDYAHSFSATSREMVLQWLEDNA